MEILRAHLSETLGDWVEASFVIFGTLFAIAATRTVLLSQRTKQKWGFLARLTPSVVNLVTVLGFRIFIEVAPLDEKLNKYLGGAAYVLVVIFLFVLIRRIALVMIEWSASKSHYSTALNQHGFIPLLRNVLNLFVFLAGTIMVLKHFNYDVLSLLTALGVGSLAVGLAAKETLANMISGFILIVDRNMRPGDRINLAGALGDVEEIGLRSTRIRTPEGNTMIVPNFDLVNNRIINLSDPTRETTASLSFRVPYSVSFAKVKEICLNVLKKTPQINFDRGNSVHLASLADGFQKVEISFWLTDLDGTSNAISAFNEAILAELHAAGIRLVEDPAG
jgi:small-conductance mechanosensitive channel